MSSVQLALQGRQGSARKPYACDRLSRLVLVECFQSPHAILDTLQAELEEHGTPSYPVTVIGDAGHFAEHLEVITSADKRSQGLPMCNDVLWHAHVPPFPILTVVPLNPSSGQDLVY